MPKALKVTLRVLLVLLAVGLSFGAFVGYTFASDWLHQRRYVESFTYNPERLYPPEALQEDFAIFRGALEESHGGLYWYTPKAAFDAAFEAAAEKLDEPMTELEFIKVVAPLVDLIRDGHTNLDLPAFYLGKANFSKQGLWPLDLITTKTGTYVEYDGSDENVLAPGTEILKINGREVSVAEDELLTLFSTADGYADGAKIEALDDPNFFMAMYSYLEGFPETFDVTYTELGSGVVKKATLRALPVDRLNKNFDERYPIEDADAEPTVGVDLRWQGNVPVLEVSSFSEGSFDAYANALESAFAEIHKRGAEQLVLDLRYNGGGSEGRENLLFTHLSPEPYRKYAEVSVKAQRSDYLRYTETPWETWWSNLTGVPFIESDFFYDFSDQPKAERWWRNESTYSSHYRIGDVPTSPPFEGQVYLLLSGAVFSGGAEFVTMAEERLPDLITIGQETSGAYQGNTSGIYYNLILPNTHLGLRLPRIKYRMAIEGDNPPGRGTLPDHEVWQTQEDIAAGVDTVMAYALELAQEQTPDVEAAR